MNTPKMLLLSMLFLSLVSFHGKEPDPPQPLLPVPTEKQLAWQEMEMNAFVHFTTNTFTGLEWGMGDESPSVFNPSHTDVSQWTRVLKDAGFKGVILTCKHHDGFCLWPSKFTDHTIQHSPYKNGQGDLVKDVSDACKQQGLKFGIYLSPWDRNRADYGTPDYITCYRNQLQELFTSYGPVFEMWFDGANGGTGYYGGANEKRTIDGKTYYDWPNTLKLVRTLQPNTLFFSDAGPDIRWVGNEDGVAGSTNWDIINPDTLYAGKPAIGSLLNKGAENGTQWIPAEVDVSIRPGWFYHEKEDSLVKSPERLFDIYLTSVGRGSNLLLNVPPDKEGLIHKNDIQALKGLREMINSEFKTNLAANAIVRASSTRGNAKSYSASNVVDNNKDTYWATDDATVSGSLEIELNEIHTVKYVVLQEYIKLGQRVKAFNIEFWKDGRWNKVAEATTIGYKRIIKIKPVRIGKMRINITDSKACPVISNIAVY
jgi:alpha-L-fucosidase